MALNARVVYARPKASHDALPKVGLFKPIAGNDALPVGAAVASTSRVIVVELISVAWMRRPGLSQRLGTRVCAPIYGKEEGEAEKEQKQALNGAVPRSGYNFFSRNGIQIVQQLCHHRRLLQQNKHI